MLALFSLLTQLIQIAGAAPLAPMVGNISAEKFVEHLNARGITDADAAVGALPENVRKYFVLMKESKSRHMATPQTPRAILFTKDARFILSFSGHENDQLKDVFEIIEFNDSNKQFEFKTLSFEGGKPVLVQEKQKCVSCHGEKLRPIWDGYHTWRGAYGEENDDMNKKPEEFAQFRSFLQTQPSHPRYKHLMIFPNSEGFGFPTPYGRPNLVFGARIGNLNAQRVAKDLKEAPLYAKYRDTLLLTSRLLSCNQYQARLSPEATTGLQNDYSARLKSFPEFANLYASDSSPSQKAMLYRTLGVDPQQELRLDHSIVSPFTPTYKDEEFYWNLSGDYMGVVVDFLILKDALESDDDLRKALGINLNELRAYHHKIFQSDSDALEALREEEFSLLAPYLLNYPLGNVGKACEHLAKKANKELAPPRPPVPVVTPPVTPPTKPPVVVTPPPVTQPVQPVVTLKPSPGNFYGCRKRATGTDGITDPHWCCGTDMLEYLNSRPVEGCKSGKFEIALSPKGTTACHFTGTNGDPLYGTIWVCKQD